MQETEARDLRCKRQVVLLRAWRCLAEKKMRGVNKEGDLSVHGRGGNLLYYFW